MVLVKLNKLFAKKYCDIAQTEVQGSSEKKKYSSPCYITCRGALKSHVFPFKTSEYAVRVCNKDIWQANALSYFKCWWKNALSFSPDPGSSPNSLMVRDLLSLSSPALIFLSSSSLLYSHECFLCHFSLFFSPFLSSYICWRTTSETAEPSCHWCHSESLRRAWCGAACSVSLRPYTPSPRGEKA